MAKQRGAGAKGKSAKRTPREKTIVVPMAVRVSVELYERFMNAVHALSGPPEQLRYASTIRAAVEREVERLERKYNRARGFPPRPLR